MKEKQEKLYTVKLTSRELMMLDASINTKLHHINRQRVGEAHDCDIKALHVSRKILGWWTDLSLKFSKSLMKVA